MFTRPAIGFVVISLALTVGCTQRNWYEGVQQSQRYQCEELPRSEREDCLKYHADSYDEYQRKRSEIKE